MKPPAQTHWFHRFRQLHEQFGGGAKPLCGLFRKQSAYDSIDDPRNIRPLNADGGWSRLCVSQKMLKHIAAILIRKASCQQVKKSAPKGVEVSLRSSSP